MFFLWKWTALYSYLAGVMHSILLRGLSFLRHFHALIHSFRWSDRIRPFHTNFRDIIH